MLGLDYTLQQGRQPSTTLRFLLLAGYVLYPIYEVSRAIHFQPLLLWPVLIFIWLTRMLPGPAALVQKAGKTRPTPLGRSWVPAVRPTGPAPTTRVSR